jgi:hypothetical protein
MPSRRKSGDAPQKLDIDPNFGVFFAVAGSQSTQTIADNLAISGVVGTAFFIDPLKLVKSELILAQHEIPFLTVAADNRCFNARCLRQDMLREKLGRGDLRAIKRLVVVTLIRCHQ